MERSLDFLGFPEYSVNTLGEVKNVKTNRILKPVKHHQDYYCVSLCNKGLKKNFRVHRLVGLAFIPNPENLPEIDHINRDSLDNRIENLRWADRYLQVSNRGDRKDNVLGEKHICSVGHHYLVVIKRKHQIIIQKYYKTLQEAITARNNCLRELDEL
jgi:hypothetical protein